MKKFKQKIYHKIEDFYSPADLNDPDKQEPPNLSIDDFDAKGRVVKPRAPCVVTTIDPEYIKDAGRQRLAKKFRMKTDILQLRDIMRTKFLIYTTQEMYLAKQCEAEHQERVYKNVIKFHEQTEKSLNEMEAIAFQEMKQTQNEFEQLHDDKLAIELKELKAQHQRVLMEVQDVYGRFKFLLKIITYFDDITKDGDESLENKGVKYTLIKPPEITELQINEQNIVGNKEVQILRNYMVQVVRPYLDKRRHLNAEIWLKGYERQRAKISQYNQSLTHVATLNHIVSIMHTRFNKTYAKRFEMPIYLRDPEFMTKRVADLRANAEETFREFELKYKEDKLSLILKGVVPVILKKVETITKNSKRKREDSYDNLSSNRKTQQFTAKSYKQLTDKDEVPTYKQVEKIHAHLMKLLNQLDSMPPDHYRKIEKLVRHKVRLEQAESRRALIKQTRWQNWVQHFKKHARQDGNKVYTTEQQKVKN